MFRQSKCKTHKTILFVQPCCLKTQTLPVGKVGQKPIWRLSSYWIVQRVCNSKWHTCIQPLGKKINRLFRNKVSMFLVRIMRILLMKVLRLTKLVQFINWQCYKHEGSPSTIFRFNKHQIAISKNSPNLITVETLIVLCSRCYQCYLEACCCQSSQSYSALQWLNQLTWYGCRCSKTAVILKRTNLVKAIDVFSALLLKKHSWQESHT